MAESFDILCTVLDILMFVSLGLSIIYVFVFALASHFTRQPKWLKKVQQYKYVVIYAAYREDQVIEAAASSFLRQNYPRLLYRIVVASEGMSEQTNARLRELGMTVVEIHAEQSSKAKALQYVVQTLGDDYYDAVIIMDADNEVEPDFLTEVNRARCSGALFIQTHRVDKGRPTQTAMLDAVSEEINNSIFRQGHVNLGLPAALIGSGMVLDYAWFRRHIDVLSGAGEDKELEIQLLRESKSVTYLPHVYVKDEKVSCSGAFYRQRRRWLASQWSALVTSIPELGWAIATGCWGYVDKIVQWTMLPRSILLAAVGGICVFTTVVCPSVSAKWWMLFAMLILGLSLAVPRRLYTLQLWLSLIKVPWLTLLMLFNLFRLRGVNKHFIHTKHGNNR